MTPATQFNAQRLSDHDWRPSQLAERLGITRDKLRSWVRQDWVNGRRTTGAGYWIVWADAEELERLKAMSEMSKRGLNQYPIDLRTPKAIEARPNASK